jgi:hypothetical protein
MFAGFLLLSSLTYAACPAPAAVGDVLNSVITAEDSYKASDKDRLEASMDFLSKQLVCLSEPIGRDLSANIHRIKGLAAFVFGDTVGMRQAFLAARALDTAYRFPPELVPAEHVVLEEYNKVDPALVLRQEVSWPKEGRLSFDGIETNERPVNAPTILQLLDCDRFVQSTQYLYPSDPMPFYPAATEGTGCEKATVVAEDSDDKPSLRPLAGGLTTAAGLGLIIGGGIQTWLAYDGCYDNAAQCADRSDTWYNTEVLPMYILGGALVGVGAIATGTGMYLLLSPEGAAVGGTF